MSVLLHVERESWESPFGDQGSYEQNPVEDGYLEDYKTLVRSDLEFSGLKGTVSLQARNFKALDTPSYFANAFYPIGKAHFMVSLGENGLSYKRIPATLSLGIYFRNLAEYYDAIKNDVGVDFLGSVYRVKLRRPPKSLLETMSQDRSTPEIVLYNAYFEDSQGALGSQIILPWYATGVRGNYSNYVNYSRVKIGILE